MRGSTIPIKLALIWIQFCEFCTLTAILRWYWLPFQVQPACSDITMVSLRNKEAGAFCDLTNDTSYNSLNGISPVTETAGWRDGGGWMAERTDPECRGLKRVTDTLRQAEETKGTSAIFCSCLPVPVPRKLKAVCCKHSATLIFCFLFEQ